MQKNHFSSQNHSRNPRCLLNHQLLITISATVKRIISARLRFTTSFWPIVTRHAPYASVPFHLPYPRPQTQHRTRCWYTCWGSKVGKATGEVSHRTHRAEKGRGCLVIWREEWKRELRGTRTRFGWWHRNEIDDDWWEIERGVGVFLFCFSQIFKRTRQEGGSDACTRSQWSGSLPAHQLSQRTIQFNFQRVSL